MPLALIPVASGDPLGCRLGCEASRACNLIGIGRAYPAAPADLTIGCDVTNLPRTRDKGES
jgi:hypothetical protein